MRIHDYLFVLRNLYAKYESLIFVFINCQIPSIKLAIGYQSTKVDERLTQKIHVPFVEMTFLRTQRH